MKKKTRLTSLSLVALSLIIIGFGFVVLKYRFTPMESQIVQRKNISTVIVPHFDIAKEQRHQTLAQIGAINNYRTIILMSTDHFQAAQAQVVTTDKNWKLSNAILLPDKIKINDLINKGEVVNQESAFVKEHGITNILPDIADSFPSAKIIPLMISPQAEIEKMRKLEANLEKVCVDNCLLIASVDFSHYNPGALAEIHDAYSIRALNNLSIEDVMKAETDSPQSLALAVIWAKAKLTNSFHLVEDNNSGKIAQSPDAESTSYVIGWFETGQNKLNEDLTFMIGGDMMFGRAVAYKDKNDSKFAVKNLGERLFWGTDVSMVNLEGPISSTNLPYNLDPENLIFSFPKNTAEALKWLNVNAVSLANNHTLNTGQGGLNYTKSTLDEKGILGLGSPNEIGGSEFGSGGQKIAVITVNVASSGSIIPKIKEAKAKGDFVICIPHWGSEYSSTHNSSQQRLAKTWIDAGADLIVGSHPHVIQDAEIYNGKPIFYSVGNLLFDQTFSAKTQQGLIIAGAFRNKSLTLTLLPVVIKNYQPQLATGDLKYSIVKELRSNLGVQTCDKCYGYDTITLNI